MDISEAATPALQLKSLHIKHGSCHVHSSDFHERAPALVIHVHIMQDGAALADESVSLLSGVASVALTETRRPT